MSDFAFKLRRPFVFDCWTLYAFSTLLVYHYNGATYFVAVNWLNNDKSSFSSVCRWIETCWSFWKKEAKKYVHIGNTLSLLLTTLKKCIEPFTKSCIAHSFLKGVLFCLWQVTFPDHCLFHLLSIHLQKTLKKSSTAKLVKLGFDHVFESYDKMFSPKFWPLWKHGMLELNIESLPMKLHH